MQAVGLWGNFKIATGMDAAAWVSKDRLTLLMTSNALLKQLEGNAALYASDYWYRLPYAKSRLRRMHSLILTSGEQGWLHARHSGQLYLEVIAPQTSVVDLRAQDSFLTTEGAFRVYRKSNDLRWAEKLTQLCEFLRKNPSTEIKIRHHYATKAKN